MTRLEEIEKNIDEVKELLKKHNDNINAITQVQMRLIKLRDKLIRELQKKSYGHPAH